MKDKLFRGKKSRKFNNYENHKKNTHITEDIVERDKISFPFGQCRVILQSDNCIIHIFLRTYIIYW